MRGHPVGEQTQWKNKHNRSDKAVTWRPFNKKLRVQPFPGCDERRDRNEYFVIIFSIRGLDPRRNTVFTRDLAASLLN
jgi:hypothetical protein